MALVPYDDRDNFQKSFTSRLAKNDDKKSRSGKYPQISSIGPTIIMAVHSYHVDNFREPWEEISNKL